MLWLIGWRLLGDANGWLAFVNAWAQWLLLALIPVGSVSLGRRWRWLATAWMAVVGGVFWRHYGSMIASQPNRTAGTAPGTRLRLLSANLRNEPRLLAQAAATLGEQNADVMLFVEAIPEHVAQLDRAFGCYPHRCWVPYCPTNMGLAAVSRYPFAVTGFWQRPGLDPFAMRLTLALPTGPLDVYCVHFVAPTHQIRRWGPTMLLRVREQQILTVLAAVAQRSYPAVLAGDWNQTEGADAYRWALRDLVDGWHQGGTGPGWTWPRVRGEGEGRPTPPLLRLDHLFHTGSTRACHVAVERMWRVTQPIGSDHCPIVADLRLQPSAEENTP